VAAEEAPFVLGNVWTGASTQDGYLLLNFLNIIFTRFEVDMFDCAYFTGRSFNGFVDDTKTPRAKFFEHLVLGSRRFRHGGVKQGEQAPKMWIWIISESCVQVGKVIHEWRQDL
jgi:hypothetical protein